MPSHWFLNQIPVNESEFPRGEISALMTQQSLDRCSGRRFQIRDQVKDLLAR